MIELRLAAINSAIDLTREFITLASGILALTVTFVKELAKAPSQSLRRQLAWSWILYLISIMLGALALMSLTGNLVSDPPVLSPRTPIPLITGQLQVVSFGVATILLILVGHRALTERGDGQQPSGEKRSRPAKG